MGVRIKGPIHWSGNNIYICIKDIFYKNDLLKSVNPFILRHQYVSGLSTLTLETSHQVPKYVTSILLKKIIILLNKHNLQIKLKQAFIQKPQRIKDHFVKDDITLNISSPSIFKNINACKLWLQVTLLSEITTIRGDEICMVISFIMKRSLIRWGFWMNVFLALFEDHVCGEVWWSLLARYY